VEGRCEAAEEVSGQAGAVQVTPGEVMYLLDTNTCIHIIRRRPESARRKLESTGMGEVAIPIVCALELEVGALRAQGRDYPRLIREFLALFPVLPLDDSMRGAYGAVRADLERRGEVIGAHDMLIAAHALSLKATLVTNNEREFRRVKGLKVENWVG
jgi:tRNA(fMet)-specific endonuclease VapC